MTSREEGMSDVGASARSAREPQGHVPRLHVKSQILLVSMLLWTILAASYTVYLGVMHDYGAYLTIWELTLDGGDPWLGSLQARNAYGPINVLLASFVLVDPLAPKVAMVATFLIVNMLVVWRLLPFTSSNLRLLMYGLFVPLNGCVIVWGIAFGGNDILVAGFVGLALIARIDKHLVWAGVFLGLAVLLKAYPALLVLFFSMDRRAISFRLLTSSAVTVGVGLAIPYLIWGGNSLNWLLYAAERGSAQLSVWNQIVNEPWLGFLHGTAFWAINVNSILVAAAVVAWLAVSWVLRVRWLPASVVGLFIALFLYKVGHGQFWIPWLILVCGLLLSLSIADLRWALACVPTAVGVSIAAFTYDIRTRLAFSWGEIQQEIGWLFFGLSVMTIGLFSWALVRQLRENDREAGEAIRLT